jgi:hypothetical protein
MIRTLGHEVIGHWRPDALDLLERTGSSTIDRRFGDPDMHGDNLQRGPGVVPGVPTLFVTGYAEPGG